MAETTLKVRVDTTEAERALGRLNTAITALGAAFAGGAITDFIDATTNLSNKLRLVTASSTELAKVQNTLLDLSSQTGAEVNAMASLYSRLSGAQDAAGLTGEGVMRMTELISKSLATAGLTVQETGSVMLQLSQAFNSGRLQGDEFRSIAEAYPPLLKMVAKEMGVTTGELKRLGSEGKITGVVLRDAFLKNANEIEKNFASMGRTLGQELNYIKNQAMKAFIEFDKATGFSQGLAAALRLVGDNIKPLITAAITFMAVMAAQKIMAMVTAMRSLAAAATLAEIAIGKIGKGTWIALIISGLALIYTKIYDAMIKPMNDFGIRAGVIARFMVQSYVNGFINVAEAAISLFPAIGKIIADSLTPGKDMSESLREIGTIMKGIMMQERLQLVNEAELKQIREYHKEINKVGQEAKKTGKYTKEAQVGISEQAHKASIAFQDTIMKMKIANDSERARLMHGERYAATQKVIAEETEKLRKAGLTMTKQQESDVAALVKQQFALKDMASTRQTLVGLADQITVLSERQASEQEVINGLLQYQRSVSAETYELNRGIVNQYLRKIETLKGMATYNRALFEIDQQRALLNVKDLNQREIASKLQQYQGQVSRDIFDATRQRVEQELRELQTLEQTDKLFQDIKITMHDMSVLGLTNARERRIEQEKMQILRGLNQDVVKAQADKVGRLVEQKVVMEDINQLLESEKYLSFGVGQEFIKLEDKVYLVQKAIENTTAAVEYMKKELSDNPGFEKGLRAQEDRLKLLDTMHKTYINEQIMLSAKLEGDRYKQAVISMDMEQDALELMRANQLITHETYLKAIKDMEFRHADDINKYKILKDMELQGNRAKIMAGNVQLMTVDRDTAEKIAQDRVGFEKKTEYDKTQFFIEQSATVFNALGAQNKQAFKAAQALNIAVALMNTYRAASVALATYPWPFSLVAAAAAVATGMAQVAAIRSQSYSGRALGGGVMGGGSYIVGERGPELFTPNTNGSITNNQDLMRGGGGATVNFTIVANDTRGFDELLTARRGLITQIISDAQLEKGRRL